MAFYDGEVLTIRVRQSLPDHIEYLDLGRVAVERKVWSKSA